MNRLVENGQITQLTCGSNFAYILNDNAMFFSTEYKVMQSQSGKYFLKCAKMLFNGKLELFYVTNALRPFAAMVGSLDAEGLLTIVSNLFASVVDVMHNGFLSCQNIDISFDKIFIDPSTLKVSLVYVPSTIRVYSEHVIFENELRTGLVKLITGVASLSSPKTMQLVADLSNGSMTMEAVYNRIRGHGDFYREQHKGAGGFSTASGFYGGKAPAMASPTTMKPAESVHTTARLVAMTAPGRVELVINKPAYVIGKNPSAVDGAVTFNNMISRVHCRIDCSDGQYTITDLKSANGTYLNRVRLTPNQSHPIKNRDVIRLANSDFQFVVE